MWSGASGVVAVTAAKALRIAGFVHVTGGEVIALPAIGYGGRLTLRGRLREAVTLRLATAVTATSEPIVSALAALGIAVERVPLGVDLQAWPARAPVPRPSPLHATLLHVGSLSRVKDQATLLRAIAALRAAGREVHLDIVGDDTLSGETQALARELDLDRIVSFRGFLPQAELRPLVEAADLLVVSSRHEAGPYVLLEAAIAGLPAVGTHVGHLAEWAPAGARTVAVGDPAALAAAIEAVLGDDSLRLWIAAAAQKRAIDENADFTAQCFEARYAALARPR